MDGYAGTLGEIKIRNKDSGQGWGGLSNGQDVRSEIEFVWAY